jgi:cysteine desulfurase/selenocysteine lyase
METPRKRAAVDWDRYREEFPITEHLLYLNHAAISPLSTRVRAAMDEVSRGFEEKGSLLFETLVERGSEIRAMIARFVGARARGVAFTRNTTQGVLTAAKGVRFEKGDRVVMPSIEFPANAYPWLSLAARGVEIDLVEPAEGRITARMIADACRERTRLVTVSLVQYSNGYRIDIEELGRFCRERGILLHVDAIQALGMIDVDFERSCIDFLSAGGHKWLLSVLGAGIFVIRPELIEDLDIWNPGWTGVVDFMTFLDYDPTYRNDATRYEEGALNYHGIYALGASVDRFLEIGMERVEKRILGHTQRLETGLREAGYEITSPREEPERSGIICFGHPSRDSEEIFAMLTDSGVVASLREGAVRLSPHFYNSEREIEDLLGLLG